MHSRRPQVRGKREAILVALKSGQVGTISVPEIVFNSECPRSPQGNNVFFNQGLRDLVQCLMESVPHGMDDLTVVSWKKFRGLSENELGVLSEHVHRGASCSCVAT